MNFVTNKNMDHYNSCHCKLHILKQKSYLNRNLVWTNFEIVNLDFYRSKEYLDYFNHLDQAGGFYYEVRK
jgi:hypothetical protein